VQPGDSVLVAGVPGPRRVSEQDSSPQPDAGYNETVIIEGRDGSGCRLAARQRCRQGPRDVTDDAVAEAHAPPVEAAVLRVGHGLDGGHLAGGGHSSGAGEGDADGGDHGHHGEGGNGSQGVLAFGEGQRAHRSRRSVVCSWREDDGNDRRVARLWDEI